MVNIQPLLIEDLFKAHERFLWGLCYRMTGNAADADDLVQETFIRAMKSPPARTDEPWLPWLIRVAMNLARDLLRRRKRMRYEGPWLPSPIETGEEASPPSFEPEDAEGNPATRYDLIESVSFAFLLALEALTPSQRATLLLRDVFDYSVKETAEALGISEQNVKTTHHRARRSMEDYDKARAIPTASLQARTRSAVERFLQYIRNHDVAGAEKFLADDVRQYSDGGGEFIAARVPIVGKKKVTLFYSTIAEKSPSSMIHEWKMMNGLPALITRFDPPIPHYAPLLVTLCDIDEEGKIKRINVVLASRKLTALSEN